MGDVLWSLIKALAGLESNAVSLSVSSIHNDLDAAIAPIWGANFETLYSIFQGPAMMMLVLYMCLDLLDKVSSENFSLDILVLDFSKMIMGIALINNGITIIHGLYGISEMCCNKIIAAASDQNILEFFGDTSGGDFESIWDLVFYIGKGFLNIVNVTSGATTVGVFELILITGISNICISIIKYQRAVRLGMRLILAPFVFADVVGHGFNSNAMHYIKIVFALCMEGPIMCITVALVPAATGGSPASLVFVGLVMTVLIIKLLFDSHKMAQEMLL